MRFKGDTLNITECSAQWDGEHILHPYSPRWHLRGEQPCNSYTRLSSLNPGCPRPGGVSGGPAVLLLCLNTRSSDSTSREKLYFALSGVTYWQLKYHSTSPCPTVYQDRHCPPEPKSWPGYPRTRRGRHWMEETGGLHLLQTAFLIIPQVSPRSFSFPLPHFVVSDHSLGTKGRQGPLSQTDTPALSSSSVHYTTNSSEPYISCL